MGSSWAVGSHSQGCPLTPTPAKSIVFFCAAHSVFLWFSGQDLRDSSCKNWLAFFPDKASSLGGGGKAMSAENDVRPLLLKGW